jgi:hypothetical protein
VDDVEEKKFPRHAVRLLDTPHDTPLTSTASSADAAD